MLTTTSILLQPLHECRDKSVAGGKAVNLGVLLRANFNVPDGFCITTDAYRHWAMTRGEEIPADLEEQIRAAYRAMGSPPVAVRSSATAEDMSEASMAGQYETFLDIHDETSLLNRIRCCWASLDSPRTHAYLNQHNIDIAQVAMAVVVQRLVPSDVSGVLFSANPQTGSRDQMLIEASWGLGEAVVSGRVQPDVLLIDRASGRVLNARIADKQIMIPPGSHDEVPVEDEKRRAPCLKSADVTALWKLGVKAAEQFGGPQDIEWGLYDGKLYLLQSRPITTLADAETYEQILQSTRARLRELIDKDRGPWVVHNLAETLPHPTPLTWSVLKRFMSGHGGFGAMYRRAGFEPSPLVCREGFLTLIAGRVYMDARLGPEMFFEGFPFRYDLDLLKKNPDAAQQPPTIPMGGLRERVAMARRAARATATVQALAQTFDRELKEKVIPALVAWVNEQKRIGLRTFGTQELLDLWEAREKRVMDDFAPQSLLPSLISGAVLADLRALIAECFYDEDPDELVNLLSSGHEPDKTLLANAQLYEVAQSEESVETWLMEYGHRAPEEFDLATPRWRERPQELLAMSRRLRDGHDPAAMHEEHRQKIAAREAELRHKLSGEDLTEFDRRLAMVRRYMPYREDGKFYLMLGYELLRHVALEMGRRLEVGDDVFLLTFEEAADALKIGFAPHTLIAQRKAQRRAEKRIALPYVIEQYNLDDLGTQCESRNARSAIIEAFAISSGVATGPARIVRSPSEAGDLGAGYILVCPSTDPSWTPLFTNAAGLILECGGTLSHGAVVAREMSIPAVVLREACSIISEGEIVSIDGRHGRVTRPSNGHAAQAAESLPYDAPELASDDTTIERRFIPPPRGSIERRAARLRNLFLLFWGIYLALVFLLPQNLLFEQSLRVLDFVYWPLVRAFGKPGAVAIIAGLFGALTMLGQRFLTDNARLLIAKERAAELQRQAARQPAGSPRQGALKRAAGGLQMRVLAASFVPLVVLLGPMIMTFFWFPQRVDPSAWNRPPGTSVTVIAKARSDAIGELTLNLPMPLKFADDQQAVKPVINLRATLERWWVVKRAQSDLSKEPWEIQEMAKRQREQERADLDEFLADMPPVEIAWRISTPENLQGRWPVTVRGERGKTLRAWIVLGDRYPASPALVENTARDPLVSLELKYDAPNVKTKQENRFFTLFGKDIGWLGVYLLAYLPVMFAFREVLRIA